jgi:hypothetical protein
MNRTEASVLLTYIARVDNRNIDREVIEVWAEMLDDIKIEAAMVAAREHLRADDRWLTPALVRQRVESSEPDGPQTRSVAEALAVPDTGGDESWQAYMRALRDGRFQAPALPAPRPVGVLTSGGAS